MLMCDPRGRVGGKQTKEEKYLSSVSYMLPMESYQKAARGWRNMALCPTSFALSIVSLPGFVTTQVQAEEASQAPHR